MIDNETLMNLIAKTSQQARMAERLHILRIIAGPGWRSKKQLIEKINGKNI